MYFKNRMEAGRYLADKLKKYADKKGVVVLGLPRGGVPVAFEVAKALRKPLDVFVVRKLGVPGQEELAMGAIASGGVHVLNDKLVRTLGLSEDDIESETRRQEAELARREKRYRGDRAAIEVKGRTAVLVDDGLATGASMRAAVQALRKRSPRRIVVAVPTAAPETCRQFESEVDEVICAITPEMFFSVGQWYEDFSQTSDDEVTDLLEKAASFEAD